MAENKRVISIENRIPELKKYRKKKISKTPSHFNRNFCDFDRHYALFPLPTQ
ncbi:hypothetical protein VFC2061_22160 [Listeria monocytogenes]